MFRYALILMLICLVSAGVLAGTYRITHPAYLKQMEEEEKQALRSLMPEAIDFQEKKHRDSSYFIGFDKNKNELGYIIRVQVSGYAAPIKMLVAIERKGKILGLKILSQKETPGLGAKITEIRSADDSPWFTSQFKGKDYKDLSLDTIQAITAATITSRAVIDGLKEQIGDFLDEIR